MHNIRELRNFSISIGTKKDNKYNNENTNDLLAKSGELFQNTLTLIKDFKNFKFPNKNDEISNMTQLKSLENKCLNIKSDFENLTNKISRQNDALLESERASRTSISNTFSENKGQQVMTVIGNDLLFEEKLLEKEKQNKQITK